MTDNNDEIRALRALLAEQTARADGLDQQLSAVLAGIKRNTKVMNGDNHLIAIAKAQQDRAQKAEAERDQQTRINVDLVIDAQRALAACAEMRAALEAIDDAPCNAHIIAASALSRPDLGAERAAGRAQGQLEAEDERGALLIRAQGAEVACAEMRAALDVLVAMVASDATDGLLAAMANAAALLARPDLGAGVVVVPREVVERVREALEHCRCRPHEHNPLPPFVANDCEVICRAIADLDAMLKKGGG